MSDISKAYEPQSVEEKWYQFWLDQKCFVADAQSKKPAYSIVIPPPNVTGVLTMGHVLNNTIQDILARKARMDGKEVLWLPGTDHAGIATQTVVERTLKKAGEIRHRDDLGREKFLERVWQWKEKHGGIIIQQLKKLGASCDWTRERFTMDPEYSRCVQKVFVELYKKGLIYRGKRMVNWCPVSLTALSDEEVIMKEQKGSLYYFKVQVAESPLTPSLSPDGGEGEKTAAARSSDSFSPTGGEGQDKEGDKTKFGPVKDSEERIWLTIATTRPETIPGDTAVAVNPKDPRYAKFIGKHVIRPLPAELPREQKLIPIVGDEHVDFEFGTGVLKVTPAHDKADFEIYNRATARNLQEDPAHPFVHPPIEVIGPDGKMMEDAGTDLCGLDRFKARKVAAEKLMELGALEKEEPYTNNVGFSERADVPIEPRLSEQWFLKYPSAEKARSCVEQTGSATVPVAAFGVSPNASARVSFGKTPNDADKTSALPQMRFHPDRWAKVYDHWMDGLQDWCISRQLWWGHRIPVWYDRLARGAFAKTISIVKLTGRELSGTNARELRQAAWKIATQSGFLRQKFKNRDTGWEIYVNRKNLEHGFSNQGLANIQLVSGLPDLINSAVLYASEPHVPPIPQVRLVHKFVCALELAGILYRVKFTVKELPDGKKLYDHQALTVQKNETDGNSPGTHLREEKLVTRPASASQIKVASLFGDVNTDKAFTRCQIEEPGPGWTQDPDVLDTWFSSWLWPFATMGWPEQTETLKKFYPTTDLVTGPDIIFFWVARMIMAGYEFMGEMPFKNVYFTGIIRDKQGRKMSKSLGNSPDPLDLIGKYGADALRFGTMRSAPLGQDILFDEQNVELGRNFCNKLWNACRFRQMQGGEVQGEINPQLLTSDDKWILLKLDAAIREMNTAFAEYKFSDATATLYRFFWSEYCDWYVEASKAALGSARVPRADSGVSPEFSDDIAPCATPDAATETVAFPKDFDACKANTLAVIDFVLSHTLRLFHPFLPFITEELWHGMGYADDMPEKQGGQTIMFAPWPKPFDDDFREHYGLTDAGDKLADAKYELVSLGRNLRREFNIQANKKIKFVFKPSGQLFALDAEILKLLLNAESVEVKAAFTPPKGTPMVSNALGELFLPLEGLVDVEAEKNRLKKEHQKITAEIAKVEQKLANPNFAQKVPPPVLEEHKRRLADWQGKLAQVKAALAALQS